MYEGSHEGEQLKVPPQAERVEAWLVAMRSCTTSPYRRYRAYRTRPQKHAYLRVNVRPSVDHPGVGGHWDAGENEAKHPWPHVVKDAHLLLQRKLQESKI